MTYQLFNCKGTGSVLTEAMLIIAGAKYESKIIPWREVGPKGNAELVAANPLGQIPTLILPNGQIMTESAAIALHLADVFPESGLVPGASDPNRAVFLRWLMFMGGPLYSPFTYGDFPDRWVEGETARKQLVASTTEHRKSLWQYLESQIDPAPWFMGDQLTALDIYVSVMTRWTPGPAWFEEKGPKLKTCGKRLEEDPRLLDVWAWHFPEKS